MSELYIGLMSGTSADGVDAALIEFSHSQPSPTFKLIATFELPYQPAFRAQLLELALGRRCEKSLLGTISAQLADLFADAVHQLLRQARLSPTDITAIGSHGHTIDHAPNNPLAYTLQITDHARLTEKTGITTVCDFRSRDVAAGGQGAPLVPAFHRWLFAQSDPSNSHAGQAIINIGGISNLTLLAEGLGFDCGPGNCLIDFWHQEHTGDNFDAQGATARQGKLLPELLSAMLADNYFAQPAPKSTGREYFNQQWLDGYIRGQHLLWRDVAYTLTALTARVIADQLTTYNCHNAFLCGGGSHNRLLVELIKAFSPNHMQLQTTQDLGIAPDWIEAAAFAWLAHQTLNNQPGNLPSATGANGYRVLGAIYPV